MGARTSAGAEPEAQPGGSAGAALSTLTSWRSPRQHTLGDEVSLEGVGLFTARQTTVTMRPAGAGTGLVFRRMDEPSGEVPALVEFVEDLPRRTALRRGEVEIQTVEHLLSACGGLGLDNAVIEVRGPEIPIFDGSSLPFAEAIERARLVPQEVDREPIVVREPITLQDGDKAISALPVDSDRFELLYMLDYGEGSPIGRQVQSFVLGEDDYLHDIAPARTFSTKREAQAAWDAGLFHHLSPADMLVIGEDGPIDNAYRFADEPVRHKLVDMIGDLALTGRPVRGRIVGVRTGHELNRQLAAALLDPALVRSGVPSDAATALDIRSELTRYTGRFPAVLVDRVLEIEPAGRAVGVKNVTSSEPFFTGGASGDRERMPGVLVVEAMAQLGALLQLRTGRPGVSVALRSAKHVTLHRAVVPGDQLVLEAELGPAGGVSVAVDVRASVSGELAAEGRVHLELLPR
ncbi:MAG: UDP-3-O-acyl-N-acetylglucosamine deacetylase [Planctomycetota bacterium]